MLYCAFCVCMCVCVCVCVCQADARHCGGVWRLNRCYPFRLTSATLPCDLRPRERTASPNPALHSEKCTPARSRAAPTSMGLHHPPSSTLTDTYTQSDIPYVPTQPHSHTHTHTQTHSHTERHTHTQTHTQNSVQVQPHVDTCKNKGAVTRLKPQELNTGKSWCINIFAHTTHEFHMGMMSVELRSVTGKKKGEKTRARAVSQSAAVTVHHPDTLWCGFGLLRLPRRLPSAAQPSRNAVSGALVFICGGAVRYECD